MKDVISMNGRVEIFKKYKDGSMEPLYEGSNAISYRAKSIMSRLLGGGLNPNTAPLYQWGSGSNPLRVTGMAFGNGGHLLKGVAGVTNTLPKVVGPVVDHTTLSGVDTSRIGLPFIGAGTYGYASQVDRVIPGTTYQKVENGNIPWDGTANISDNDVGVLEANTTLYSETFRVPLDSSDGVSYPTNTEVQFKATLPAALLNYANRWGFSAQPANLVSELGLISGYSPTAANITGNVGQIYSHDGGQPATGTGFTFAGGDPQSNWGSTTAPYYWDSKDGSGATVFGGISTSSLNVNKTRPSTVANGVDTFAANYNTWNMVARKVIPAIPKTSSFSLVFVWTIGL